jgi:sulfatase modifying factor 1
VLPGGRFTMGSDRHYPEEAPARQVCVPAFAIDRGPVTNAAFAAFVGATGHVTVAERAPDPAAFPGVPVDALIAGSLVFRAPPAPPSRFDVSQWWHYVPGACWHAPEGPGSDVAGRETHPVVHVAHDDAVAYANWAGATLPTEAEWEFAARGGLDGAPYAWGDVFAPDGRALANTWQGAFPWQNLATDGYAGTSPVGAFPANGYGLRDMIGNVWEWTSDWWQAESGVGKPCCSPGADAAMDASRSDPGAEPRKVLKGGSHLCAPNYCRRYRPAARSPQELSSSASHIGFRCIVRAG